MKFKDTLNADDKALFKEAVAKVKPLVQDTIVINKKTSQIKQAKAVKKSQQQHAEFYFSDQFEPHLSSKGPTQYVREDISNFEAKNLRRGHYSPDLILDLHGLDQQQSKREIAALLAACQKEHARCVCIVHGLGSRVLKNKVPHWLVQHPDVMAFHQAPLEWGGDGALLVLIELKDKNFLK